MSERARRGLPWAPTRSRAAGAEPTHLMVLGACLFVFLVSAVLACGGDDDADHAGGGAGGDEGARISAYGLRADLPQGWDGRIRWPQDDEPHGSFMPTMHLASFPLPASDGSSFGEHVTPAMADGQIFAALVEYSPASVGGPAFRGKPPTGLGWDDLDRRSVKVQAEGQVGLQERFTANGRAFTLFVVASEPRDQAALDQLNDVLESLQIDRDRERGSRPSAGVGPSAPR